jgi:hypothetical protein
MSLKDRVALVESQLSPVEKTQLSDLERQAMNAETAELISKTKGSNKMATRLAQTPPGAPGVMPPQEEVQAGHYDEHQSQAVDPNMPMQAQTPPDPPQPAAPPAPPGPGVEAAAPEGIENYIDEKEGQGANQSPEEMGISPQAAYRSVYGHLRLRPTANRDLDVFDPTNQSVLMTVRPNMATKANLDTLRKCGVLVLQNIAAMGLSKTAKKFKAQLRTAAGGVVDFGDNTFASDAKPDYENPGNGINAKGDSNYADTKPNMNGVDTTVNNGEVADRVPHQNREAPGLAEKPLVTKGAQLENLGDDKAPPFDAEDAAKARKKKDKEAALRLAQNAPMKPNGPPSEIVDKGSLGGHVTNMSDEVNNRAEGNALDVTDMYDSNMRDDRKPYEKGTAVTDGEIDTFANESITASVRLPVRKAQAPMPQQMPPMQAQAPVDPNMAPVAQAPMTPQAPGSVPPVQAAAPVEPSPDMTPEQEKVLAAYMKEKIAKEVQTATRNFVAKFVRCIRLSARRQAMNMEPNQIKIAMADALMTPAMLSRHEEFVPMDERTATFVIEQGLNVPSALSYTDSLIKGAQRFFKMSDIALAQVEEDLSHQTPTTPQPVEGQMEPPMDGGAEMAPTAEEGPPMPNEHMTHQEPGSDPAEHMASMRRQAALEGNLPVNPGASPEVVPTRGADKRMNIRAALSSTQQGSYHNHLSQKFG